MCGTQHEINPCKDFVYVSDCASTTYKKCSFYKLLFEEKLGYMLEKKFVNYPFYFSDDFADESFQSYDHPPVIIFENVKKFDFEQIYDLIVL